MPKLVMDYTKLKVQGEELKAIAKDYNRIIDDIYEKLVRISDNNIWISDSVNGSANKFIRFVKNDKENVKALGTNINSLGDLIVSYSNVIKKISDIEVNK